MIRAESEKSEKQDQARRDLLASKSVPNIQANFKLKYSSFSFVNNKDNNEGIEVFSEDFAIEFRKYDVHNTCNVHVFSMEATNGTFGIN